MYWVILANTDTKKEFLVHGISDNVKIEWALHLEEFQNHPSADAFFDLQFRNKGERENILRQLLPRPVIINSVIPGKMNYPFIRINAWSSFLQRVVIEASCADEPYRKMAEKIFSSMKRKTEWMPETTGFISARIVAAIINEAYFTLQENVSTKEEIDIAMKLGTNYPYGPFEWAQKIGLENIYELLASLSQTEKRYIPADLLTQEAMP